MKWENLIIAAKFLARRIWGKLLLHASRRSQIKLFFSLRNCWFRCNESAACAMTHFYSIYRFFFWQLPAASHWSRFRTSNLYLSCNMSVSLTPQCSWRCRCLSMKARIRIWLAFLQVSERFSCREWQMSALALSSSIPVHKSNHPHGVLQQAGTMRMSQKALFVISSQACLQILFRTAMLSEPRSLFMFSYRPVLALLPVLGQSS